MHEGIKWILCVIVGSIVVVRFSLFFKNFQDELRYINNELQRTVGEEKKYWKKKRWKLWFSFLPFIRY